jgi:hypothetical protein
MTEAQEKQELYPRPERTKPKDQIKPKYHVPAHHLSWMAEGPIETERITLSQRERDRLKVLHEVKQKRLSQLAAAARLKVSDCQVRRMLLRIRERGDAAALVHGLRGRPSNRRLAARLELNILRRVRQRYAQHLAQEGLPVSRETLRKPQYHVPAKHPREETVEPDISTLR